MIPEYVLTSTQKSRPRSCPVSDTLHFWALFSAPPATPAEPSATTTKQTTNPKNIIDARCRIPSPPVRPPCPVPRRLAIPGLALNGTIFQDGRQWGDLPARVPMEGAPY